MADRRLDDRIDTVDSRNPSPKGNMVDESLLAEVPAHILETFTRGGSRPNNLHRALAHDPALLEAWMAFSSAVRTSWRLGIAERELVILRVAAVLSSPYLWSHHEAVAVSAGLSREQVDAVKTWTSNRALFGAREHVLLELTDAATASLASGDRSEQSVVSALEHFDMRDVVSVVATAASYAMTACVIEALCLPIDPPGRG